MRAAILCPNSNSARFSAGRLLENGIDVTFYCPEALDEEQAADIIHEMNYVGAQQNRLRNTVIQILWSILTIFVAENRAKMTILGADFMQWPNLLH